MKHALILLILTTLVSCQAKREKLLLAGSGWNKMVIIDKQTKEIEWDYTLKKGWEVNSAVMMNNGNILFSYSKGAKVINRKKEEIWDIKAPKGAQMQTARKLPNGNFLIAWCGHPATFLEVNSKGAILSTTKYDTKIRNVHAQFRQLNKTKEGLFLVPLFATHDLRLINKKGEVIKKIKVGGTPFTTVALDNGNYLIACGDGHNYKEVNLKNSKFCKVIDRRDIDGVTFHFVAQLLKKKKSLYICNWQGHSSSDNKKNPQLIEIDKYQNVIWKINNKHRFGMISTISSFYE